MALVPFRVSGPAADQSLQVRTMQLGGYAIRITQDQQASASLQPLQAGHHLSDEDALRRPGERLDGVGFVVWQSAFVLLEYLLRCPPFGQWADVRVVELGSGTGVGGIALVLAGADVLLTDLTHVVPLTSHNVTANCGEQNHRSSVCKYTWGDEVKPLGPQPDLIIGSDVVYQQEYFDDLIDTIWRLSAPHTLTFLAYRVRGRGEDVFRAKLDKKGFAVIALPPTSLHEEYADGQYVILRICKV
ncbi:hypothetical protein WJX73_005953 [Symbiochloris irregularis]|uniref:Uncharacterized protein n=1 Tax=Symbiochloris irregularis TaxID=706552 RepID=A0AAW1Q3W3_9CHLO